MFFPDSARLGDFPFFEKATSTSPVLILVFYLVKEKINCKTLLHKEILSNIRKFSENSDYFCPLIKRAVPISEGLTYPIIFGVSNP